MSVRFVAVNWNRQKRVYDGWLALGVVICLATFALGTLVLHPTATVETILIRGLGVTALLLLHLALAIGPLCRLDPRFLPLLYNRRHLGVTIAFLGLAHAAFVIVQYHAFGDLDPFLSLLVANQDYRTLRDFPFELFGVVALAILVVMAAISHDYWLSALTPPVWKRIHSLGYLAYLALILHVGLGVLQDETASIYLIILAVGSATLGSLHLVAALRERRRDRLPKEDQWVDICGASEIPEGRAKIGVAGGERVAVFRHQGRLSAVSNVCKHQNGPLGEGRIIDGCITCPWHGYQYFPDSGTSPPPFTDTIPTFRLRVEEGRVLVDPTPNPPGTRVEPVPVSVVAPLTPDDDFYVGYHRVAPPATARFLRRTVTLTFAGSMGLVAFLAALQRGFAPSRFDYGDPSVVEGTVRVAPYPTLEISTGGSAPVRRYLLAEQGKHGAQSVAGRLDGRRVRLTGPIAHRGNLELLEIATDSILDTARTEMRRAATDLGAFELEGEIVDSKCYLGVMNPGQGKVHRGCAARCLSGGLTPLFVAHRPDGMALEMILAGPSLEPLHGVAGHAGKRVVATGHVLRDGDLWYFALDPRSASEIDRDRH